MLQVKTRASRRKKVFVTRSVWRLKETDNRQAFESMVAARATIKCEGDVKQCGMV